MFLLSGFPGINKFKELKIVFGLGSRALLGCKLEPCWAREPKQKTFKVRTLAAIGPFKGCLATYVVYFLEKKACTGKGHWNRSSRWRGPNQAPLLSSEVAPKENRKINRHRVRMLDLAFKKGQAHPIILTHVSVAFGKLVTFGFSSAWHATTWDVGDGLSFPRIYCYSIYIYIIKIQITNYIYAK